MAEGCPWAAAGSLHSGAQVDRGLGEIRRGHRQLPLCSAWAQGPRSTDWWLCGPQPPLRHPGGPEVQKGGLDAVGGGVRRPEHRDP